MQISKFDYTLPKDHIANSPAKPRDSSKLMIVDRNSKKIQHDTFSNLPNYLTENDLLVFNDTRVFPARLLGKKLTGAKIEVLLLEHKGDDVWSAIHRGKINIGDQIIFGKKITNVVNKQSEIITIKFNDTKLNSKGLIFRLGTTPLPPYINTNSQESKLRDIYQTVYSKVTGSAAAPTAGLHFTKKLMRKLEKNNIQIEFVTLHVGLDTFAPIKTRDLKNHTIHTEKYSIEKNTYERIMKAKRLGKRIISIGTTSTRVLESLGINDKLYGNTDLFIYPPYKFKLVDGLITNFHLPRSTLLAMISAFVTQPNTNSKFTNFQKSLLGKAYQEAIKKKYRFYSFGDAMLIL